MRVGSRIKFSAREQGVISERFTIRAEGLFMHYLLFYEVADDYVERRAQFRNVHLTLR